MARLVLIVVSLLAFAACTEGGSEAPSPDGSPAVSSGASPTPAGDGPCVDSVVIQGGRANPAQLTVRAPCAVLFTNRDDAVVQIQGEDTTPFTLGEMGKDQSWAHTYRAPGRYEFFNTRDPVVRGTVVVQ